MKKSNAASLVFGAVGMLVLILDGKTAMQGIQHGIDICLRTLIPSLFPFFVLSGLVTGGLMGRPIRLLKGVARLCRIPEGAESLLAVGFLGGYPVGARVISDAASGGRLSRADAQRMAVFCNNAGPSFLFGILGPMFSELHWVWVLWVIQILSAVMTGHLLPGGSRRKVDSEIGDGVSLPEALNGSIKSMAQVAGWVILFRMVLEFLNRWLLWPIPVPAKVLLTGFLELSNGCLCIESIDNEILRFLLAAFMLSTGGICVWMQTKSVFPGLDMIAYLKGKALQCAVSMVLSVAAVMLLSGSEISCILILLPVTFGALAISRKRKKEVAII